MTSASKGTSSDLSKELSEWALAAGRYFQSEQTGYIHLYYGKEAEQKAQTIPLVENVLFAFTLLRSRLVEQVQEAKKLLKGVLIFQNRQEGDCGNFPVYLHEYPACHDSALALQLLAPFYWILKQFGHVLGSDLKQQLEQAARLALEQSSRCHQLAPFPYSIAVRLAAAQLAYGMLWEKLAWQQAGKDLLDQLAQRQLEGWHTTRHLADILVGLQMVYPSLSKSPWQLLWQRMEQTWHPQLACYMGPCIREWQEREEPQVNLYDLFAGFFADQFSRRATLLSSHHLHGILIQPSPDKFGINRVSLDIQGELKQQAWHLVYRSNWAYTVLEKKGAYQPAVDKTHTPFRLIWGDLHRVHSLVCQGGNIEKVEYREENQALSLLLDLRDQSPEEESNPKREVEFFVDFHPDIQFHLNGDVATTFELGQKVKLSFAQQQLEIAFNLIEGEGDFLGHVMRGNRPSQFDQKGDKRFQAFDWTFFLRTIRRRGHCKLQIHITHQERHLD
jgi:hypothetical protein